MPEPFTEAELIAFLDEQLAPDRSAELERQVRQDDVLRQRLIDARGRSLAGLHTLGAIWRRRRLSCPDRETLTQFLAGKLDAEHANWIRFHLDDIACRICIAQIDDLRAIRESSESVQTRRTRWYQSSAGHLRKRS